MTRLLHHINAFGIGIPLLVGVFCLAGLGCGDDGGPTTSLTLVNLSNESAVQFDITRVEVWSPDRGCSGVNILEGALGPDSSTEIGGIEPPERIGFCIWTTAGNIDPATIEGAGWNFSPGCDFEYDLSWNSFEQGVSYVTGRFCPE